MTEEAKINFSTNAARVSREIEKLERSNRNLAQTESEAQRTNAKTIQQQQREQAERKRTAEAIKREAAEQRKLNEERKRQIERRQRVLQAVGKVGGSLGGAIGQTGESVAQGRGFMAFNIAMIGAGLAMRGLTASVNQTIEAKKQEFAAIKQLNDQMKAARKASLGQLGGTLQGESASIRQGISTVGEARFNELRDEARRASLIGPGIVAQIVEASASFQRSGRGSINPSALIETAGAAQQIGIDPSTVIAQATQENIIKAINQRGNFANNLLALTTGQSAEEIASKRRTAAGSGTIQSLDRLAETAANVSAKTTDQALLRVGDIMAGMRSDLGALLAPEAAIRAEQTRIANEQLENLRQIQESMGTAAKVLNEFGGAVALITSGQNTGLTSEQVRAGASLNAMAGSL